MKSSQSSKWAALLLTGAITLSLSANVFAAPVQAGLKPNWTSPTLFTSSVLVPKAGEAVIHDIQAMPAKKQVVVYLGQNVPNTTNKTKQLWYVDTLKALDTDTGQLKWEYVFHDSKGPYTISGSSVFNSSGTAYVYQAFSDKTYRLYSVNSGGTLNWVQQLQGPSSITLLKDGSILAAATGAPDSKGNVKTTLTRFDSAGKVQQRQQAQGAFLFAQGDRIILAGSPMVKSSSGVWQNPQNPRLEVYDASFKPLYAYQVPAGSKVGGEGGFGLMVQNDGALLLRTSANGTTDKLHAFAPQGGIQWERSLPAGALTASTGNGYVVYDNGTLTLYHGDQKSVSRTFEGEGSKNTVLLRTDEGHLILNLKEHTYVLASGTLNTLLQYSNGNFNAKLTSFGDNAAYTAAADGKLTKLTVQAGK